MRSRDYYHRRVSPWLQRTLMVVLALVMVYAAWQLISYAVQMNEARTLRAELAETVQSSSDGALEQQPGQLPEQEISQVQTAVPTVPEEPAHTAEAPAAIEPEPTALLRPSVSAVAVPTVRPYQKPEILMTYQALWERNNDLVGWLNVKALPQVDIPVVHRDQTYYLRRDFDGRDNINGTAFMDKTCSIWPRSDNLIIYAHNMKSGEMFGGLHKLMKEIFYRENPLTSFNTIYERANYVPVAVVLCSIHREDEDFFNFYVTNFRNEAAFDSYIAQAREMSEVDSPYDVQYGDDLLTLVTCYDEANRKRLLVILRRVRENESLEELAQRWK